MSNEQQSQNSQTCIHNFSIQADKEAYEKLKGSMSFARPLEEQIEEWWLTQKQDGPKSNKYSITSTGNGNVDIPGK